MWGREVRLELQGLCIQAWAKLKALLLGAPKVLELIEGTLLRGHLACLESRMRPKAENGEPMVFYKKMQAILALFQAANLCFILQ